MYSFGHVKRDFPSLVWIIFANGFPRRIFSNYFCPKRNELVFCNSSNFILTGVPAFYMNGHKMFSGAQEPDAFKRMFEIAAEKFPLPSSKT